MTSQNEISYDFSAIEEKWQKSWESKQVFAANDSSKKKKYYVLDMFPYPSGAGLHMGHAFVFSLGDIYARFKRLQGYEVLYPIGYDSLGLPAENAAIKAGTHPKDYTASSIKNFMKQQKAMGWSYDWNRMVKTSDPDYYTWDQWIFLQMIKQGVAYRKKSGVNWCSDCQTVLANEQVVNGKCWRHEDRDVVVKHLEQWYFRTTDYAEELLDKLDDLDWPETAKKLQKHWIGKSYGTEVDFMIEHGDTKEQTPWPIFTTRVDTLYGVTFMVVSLQHAQLDALVTKAQRKKVDALLKKVKTVSEKAKASQESVDKEGVFTGSYAINPLTGEKVPVYAGNFVVADYATGMVMAVPAHDQRDYEFAIEYDLPIKQVIDPTDFELDFADEGRAYTGSGRLIHSESFDGLDNKEAIAKITDHLEKKKLGRKKVQYKLRDWLVSRQRYWGTPIPIVYCEDCGVVPVPEEDLPVKLPEKVQFGKGNPLTTAERWLEVSCPTCKAKARRETDTMDTFVNSSWYFLRYTDPANTKKIFDSKQANAWCPVDQYIGGPEHITMHLIYARFYTKFLRDIGLITFDEPAQKYFTQGIVKGTDGEKMSKSRGNVIEPFDMIAKYGADTLRLALVSIASPDKDFSWDEKIVTGSHKFLQRVFAFGAAGSFAKTTDKRVVSKLHSFLKAITPDVESFSHNLAAIKLRQFFDYFCDKDISKKDFSLYLQVLGIYCPFLCEELWHRLGNKGFISLSSWPKYDEKKIDEQLERQEAQIDALVGDVLNIMKILEGRGEDVKQKSVFIYAIPPEVPFLKNYASILTKRIGLQVTIADVKDAKSSGKQVKAKPGKPGIVLA